jgi:hypothetical protein
MADTKSKSDEKNEAKAEEVKYTGTGRPLMPQEGDPKAAAEASTNASVAAGPVEADEAEPGQPVVDPHPAYDPEAEAEAEAEAEKDAKK